MLDAKDIEDILVLPLAILIVFMGLMYGALTFVRDIFGMPGLYALLGGVAVAFVVQLRKVLDAEQPGAGWKMLGGALCFGLLPLAFLGISGVGRRGDSVHGLVSLLLVAWFPLVLVAGNALVGPALERRRARRRCE